MKRRDAAFTLIEVLIALAILAAVFAAVALPMLTVYRMNATSKRTLDATAQAQQLLEAARTAVLANYANPNLPVATYPGLTCNNVDVFGGVMPGTCASNSSPPARRLAVTVAIAGQNPVSLSVDVNP